MIHLAEDSHTAPPSGAGADGREMLHYLEDLLENGFNASPHIVQRQIAQAVINAIAPQLMGDAEWERMGSAICEERDWDSVIKLVLASAPRRFGKSQIIAMLIVAVSITIHTFTERNFTQVVLSTGRRASWLMRDYVVKFIREAGWGDHIQKEGGEEVILRKHPNRKSPASHLFFYPANPKVSPTLRDWHLPLGWSMRNRWDHRIVELNDWRI